MGRRESAKGFGDRCERVRLRLGYQTKTDFAETMRVKPQTYNCWVVDDSSPGMHTLKRAIRRLGVAEWDVLVLWLADGEGPEPSWLRGSGPVPPDDRTPGSGSSSDRLEAASSSEDVAPARAEGAAGAPAFALGDAAPAGGAVIIDARALLRASLRRRDATGWVLVGEALALLDHPEPSVYVTTLGRPAPDAA